MKSFYHNLNNKKFKEAAAEFCKLAASTQEEILENLYQKIKLSSAPQFISVLERILHPGKSCADFHAAWLPPKEYYAQDKDGEFYNYFQVPTTVVMAENINNPNDIIAVGFTWATDLEFKQEMERIGKSESMRAGDINKIATKTFGQLYKTKYSHNLGTRFK